MFSKFRVKMPINNQMCEKNKKNTVQILDLGVFKNSKKNKLFTLHK